MKSFSELLTAAGDACSSLFPIVASKRKAVFDTALPDLNNGNWYETMHTDFTKIKDMQQLRAAGWAPSTHGLRKYEYWCDRMIEFTDDGLVIHSRRENNHECDICGVKEGVFTGGIETREKTGGKSIKLFEQAFGYFEATVIVPRGLGMWSAFWLQSDDCGKIGHKGEDGTEIDIYESSFINNNPTKTGQALHYDAYQAPYYRCKDNIYDTKNNLYDGEAHTYALKWTPNCYVMYVDGKAVWATDAGGVSKVPEYMRLTVEIRNARYGPYAQEIGRFENREGGINDFTIKDVKVYQNKDYEPYIKNPDDYKDKKRLYNGIAFAAGAAALLTTAAVTSVKAAKNKNNK